jgi:hypothetical protein
MLRQPYLVGQPFHRLETGSRANMGTASEVTLGLYREGDSDAASGVTGIRGLFDLPEALGTDHHGKAPHLPPVKRARRLLQCPGDVAEGLSGLRPLPQLLLARFGQPWATQSSYTPTSDPNNTDNLPRRCTNPSNPRGSPQTANTPIRRAVARVPHQLCQSHYLREAAK